MSVRSKCIDCGQRRACIKVEARAPLAHPVVIDTIGPDGITECQDESEYESYGPMVEICRKCLRDQGVLGKYLASEL